MSASPRRQTNCTRSRQVRFVPQPGSCTAANSIPYSMTSLARASSFVGGSRPSALKVRKSIDLDVRSIHDSCPFLCLCSDEGREVLGRAHLGFSAELGEDRSHLLGFHNRVNFGVEPVDNRCGGCSGCEDG